jgi:hypothetical protein
MSEETNKINDVTKDFLKTVKEFNINLLKEAVRQMELRIKDEISFKERIDDKAYKLLFLFLSSAFLLFFTVHNAQCGMLAIIPLVAIIASIIMSVIALIPKDHCVLGSQPSLWLHKESIEFGNQERFGYTMSVLLFETQPILEESVKSNAKRRKILDYAIKAYIAYNATWLCCLLCNIFAS